MAGFVKEGLEGLKGRIDGLMEINVQVDLLSSSTGDLMLYSVMEDEEALKRYAKSPLHLEVANNRVRPFVEVRSCVDFEV